MKKGTVSGSAIVASMALLATSGSLVSAHHSFAMYDQGKVVTLTGVVKQYVPQANHAEFHVYLLAPDHKGLAKSADGKNVEWGVEMAGTSQLERQGVTAASYPAGTVISFKVNPLRDGSNFGARVGALVRCPADPATKRPVLPAPGKHCDSVPGHILTGGTTF